MVVSHMTGQLICRFKERQNEVEELTQQLQTETISRKSAAEDHRCSEDEKQQLSNENENLKRRLDEEKRRSANIELQVHGTIHPLSRKNINLNVKIK